MPQGNNSGLRGAVLRVALVIGVVVILYYGGKLLIPLTLAALFALLLNPVQEKLLHWGWPNWAAIAGAVSLLLIFFGGLTWAIANQAVDFASDWESTKAKLEQLVIKTGDQFPIVEQLLPEKYRPDGDGSTGSMEQQLPVDGDMATQGMTLVLTVLADFFLMIVYVVLFLSQKHRLREFVLRRAPDERRGLTHRTLNESQDVAQKYLRGRVVLIVILGVFYSIGFLLAGLNYAILLAVLAAVLSIIPYVGNLIGLGIALVVATTSGSSTTAILTIVGTMFLTQLIESYVLLPLIVGDEVNINPLTTIVAVVAFGLIWGAVGAIVAIPLVAMVRIVCSHVEGLEDYAYLLGQEDDG